MSRVSVAMLPELEEDVESGYTEDEVHGETQCRHTHGPIPGRRDTVRWYCLEREGHAGEHGSEVRRWTAVRPS
jgi:hypothetical protein